jgi:hypothetical protein
VSLCLLPADEDGLIEAEEADEETVKRERASNAARLLASRKASLVRVDADDVEHFDFLGNLSKFERTQVGGLRVPARLTRTGVLQYRQPDGTIRRELRLPEEVFNSDSLATLTDAPVTNIKHHGGLLDPSTWKEAALGHTTAVRQDGIYVVADLIVNDATAIVGIETGGLHDISCGYRCKLRREPGVWNGERYDCIQYDIRYNHVAVLPRGRGRAGPDVSLRLDSNQAESVEFDATTEETRMDPNTKVLIKLDGKDLEYGSKEHISHLETAHLKDLERFDADKAELTTRCDKAEGKVRAFEKKEEEDKKTSEEAKRASEASSARAFRQRLKLIRSVTRALDIDEDDEEKMDAIDAKGDRDLMLDMIRMDARWKDEKFDGKSDDYVLGIYETVKKSFARTDGVDSVVDAVERAKRLDGIDTDPEAVSRANMNKGAHEAWTKPLS